MTSMNWADEVDDESATILPPRTESAPDQKGIVTIVEWSLNEDKKRVKHVKRVQSVKRTNRVNKNVEERLKWTTFGEESQKDNEKKTSVTTVSTEEIVVERPQMRGEVKKEDPTKSILDFGGFYARLEARKRGELPEQASGPPADGAGGEASASGAPARYVPPSLRKGAGAGARQGSAMNQRDDSNTLRVTNLPEEVTEYELGDLFRRYGPVSRVYVVKDKWTGASRGFAFVSFDTRRDAEKAMEKLNGYGMDNLIICVEWARNKDQ